MTPQELQLWHGAMHCQDKSTQIVLFEELDYYAKINVNLGLLYQFSSVQTSTASSSASIPSPSLQKQDSILMAIQYYSRAIALDAYFALAYFLRAFTYIMVGATEKAVDDYKRALDLLLDNACIDYTQLGLPFVLYRCELEFNLALCALMLKDVQECNQRLVKAKKSVQAPHHSQLIHDAVVKGVNKLQLFVIQEGLLFSPRMLPPDHDLSSTDSICGRIKMPSVIYAIEQDGNPMEWSL